MKDAMTVAREALGRIEEDIRLATRMTPLERVWREAKAATSTDRSVYFVTSDDRRVKIGLAGNFDKRLRALQTSHPDELVPILVVPGSRRLEQAIHVAFQHLRLRGEWFTLEPELRQFIAKMAEFWGVTGIRWGE
jgi:hypothetical protein